MPGSLLQGIAGLLFAIAISLSSRKLKFLSRSGATAQFFLGWLLFGLGGLQWTLPILLFFLSSSLLSKSLARRDPEAASDFEKPDIRDAWQVIANGGVVGLLLCSWYLQPVSQIYVASLGAVAAAAADTWGTELGLLSSRKPRLITTLGCVERGRSGGVTLMGLGAGLGGSVAVGLSGLPWLSPDTRVLAVGVVAASGFIGSLADSLLGAAVQVQYRCTICSKITEKEVHCGCQTHVVSGVWWVKNDAVNLFCTFVGAIFAYFLFVLLLATHV